MPLLKKRKGSYNTANAVQLIKGGAEYFSLLEKLIDEAKHSIHLQVYIFDENETGQRIADALTRAAERGVKVYFIVDGYATAWFSEGLRQRFRKAGVRFRRFAPLLRSKYFYFGRRLHHKVFVADSKHALVGGINISNRYNDMPDQPAWLDRALYVEGLVAQELVQVCCDIWNKAFDETDKIKIKIDEKELAGSQEGQYSVRVRINDWVRRRNEVWRSYFEMINNAEDTIIIMCSYFMPGWIYRQQMAKAIKRGVKIKVILSGKSDVPLSKYAERYLYRWMLENGMQLYEYQHNILHAKLALYDGKWLTIGSYNVNDISALASIELNLDVRNKPFVKQVEDDIEQLIKEDCEQVTYENYKLSTGWFTRKMHLLAYQVVKLMLFVVTFYYKQKES